MSLLEITVHGGDQGRSLHRRDQMIEEALLGALERRTRRRLGLAVERAGLAGDVSGLQRRIEIVVDDLERGRIGVVDADLLVGELMFEEFIFDAREGERAGRIKAERLEVAGE